MGTLCRGNSALGSANRVIGKVPSCWSLTMITGGRYSREHIAFLSSHQNACLVGPWNWFRKKEMMQKGLISPFSIQRFFNLFQKLSFSFYQKFWVFFFISPKMKKSLKETECFVQSRRRHFVSPGLLSLGVFSFGWEHRGIFTVRWEFSGLPNGDRTQNRYAQLPTPLIHSVLHMIWRYLCLQEGDLGVWLCPCCSSTQTHLEVKSKWL